MREIILQICLLFIIEVSGKSLRNSSEKDMVDRIPQEIAFKQFFQDIFSEQLAPEKLQFGHVCENPNHWEQRFEEKDFAGNRHRGKVKWGNRDGGYGEHYWDLNH